MNYANCPNCGRVFHDRDLVMCPICYVSLVNVPQPGREDVNLTELSDDKRAAVRAIVDGRSVIYRCSIKGGTIRTTSGPTIIGNAMEDVQINDDPVYIGSNKFSDCKVQSTGAITRNYFT